ncbi:MAG: T9SS type A sorting domain-containing protein [Flavobacteriales bacterium]|jgi:hypothetical protein|nr:T9SS type A sorting domain-containing protein [Flavobacteriales bacterium]
MKNTMISFLALFFYYSSLSVNAQQWLDLAGPFSNGQALSPSMEIHNGVPYVAYAEQNTSGTIFRATVRKYNGTNWEILGNPGFSAARVSDVDMTISNAGDIYVAYRDWSNNKITVMRYDAFNNVWNSVGSAGFSGGALGEHPDIKLDNNGFPYVAFRYKGSSSSAPYQLKVMKFDGVAWQNVGSGVISGVRGATGVSLAMDNNTPYVTCLNAYISDATTVFTFNGTSWVNVGAAAASVANADHQSIAVHNGTPYVAYRDWGNGKKTTVRQFNGTSWVDVGTAGFSSHKAEYQSITIDNTGTLYVAYSNNSDYGSGGQSTVMKFDGTSWVTVGTPNFSTANSAFQNIVVDDGVPYVNYMEGNSLRANVKAYVCEVSVPDAILKQTLLNDNTINTNNNFFLECSEASAYTGALNLGSLNISDATGLEAFINATALQIQGNQLTSLDLSANNNLETISCNVNNISNLIIGTNTALESLYAGSNNYTTLDLSGATNLNTLDLGDMPTLTGIDLTANVALQDFYCSGSTSIGGTGLIKTIDFSQNSQLTAITVQNCNLNSLDVSTNSNLVSLNCNNNNLEYLNVANGNNANMGSITSLALDALNNSNLTCVQIDNGFTPTTTYWQIDAGASYSNSCTPLCYVNIPDANFKAYLVGNSSINTNGNTEIDCSEASAFTGTIDCSNLNITDLTGIEAFVNITALFCQNNTLNSLDISQNTALETLNCFNTNLNSLNITQNIALIDVYCHDNSLSNLDLTQNTDIEVLWCGGNTITSLDVSQNIALTTLRCQDNLLSALDVSQNSNLDILWCSDNNITVMDISQNPVLTWLFCSSNSLTSLNVANGNNGSISDMYAQYNPSLTCIQHDAGFDPTTNSYWLKDLAANWSDNCNPSVMVTSITVQGQGGATAINVNGGTLQMIANVLPINATDGTYTWSVTNGTGNATIDANGLLTAIGNGTVDVIATANDGSGVTGSATITITNQGVGIKESTLSAVTVYPNPVVDLLFIDSQQLPITRLQLMDLSGKIIQSIQHQNIKNIEVSTLKQGVYFLKVETEQGISTIQFIKQ